MKEDGVSIKRLVSRRAVCVGLVVIAASLTWAAFAATATRNGGPPPRAVASSAAQSKLVEQLALARLATAKYVSDLPRAKADGYQIITKMIPNMGYHYMNASVKGFDVRKPPILVYEHRGASWQLAALEWVFTAKPARPPLAGARYGSFGAGCHYADGTFVPAETQDACPKTSPQTSAAFGFWHPLLITMHVWLWYPNPTGLFASTNPLAAAYNNG
jgi:hypothetical protein